MKIKQFPYGQSNYENVATTKNRFVFVDKTPYIEVLENLATHFNFLLRPRRFGKSLFVSMLGYYYGIEYKEKFEYLFGEYYIGKNPTPKANGFLVLSFEFSRIDTSTPEKTYEGFLFNVKLGIKNFFARYGHFYAPPDQTESLEATSPEMAVKALFNAHKNQNIDIPIYLLIDEYDHFANEILAFRYEDFLDSVGRNGFVRKFYESIKTATMDGVVERLFVTGVTPITLDSMTSGFNIGTDLTQDIDFQHAMGFTFEEVKDLVEIACAEQTCDKNQIYKDLKKWYNGYAFNSSAKNKVYNPDMVLYFLNILQKDKQPPVRILDVNIASDYGKIKRFFQLKNPAQNYVILEKLLYEGTLSSDITAKFSFEKAFSKTDFISLLFYMGFVSLGTRRRLQMPNYVIKSLYFDYFFEILTQRASAEIEAEDLRSAVEEMMFEGRIDLFAQEVQGVLKKLSNRDSIQFSEKHLKVLVFTLLNLCKNYYVKSEYETEKKYIDILLLEREPFPTNFQYAFELKYLPKQEADRKPEVVQNAMKQLNIYLQTEEIQALQNLRAFVLLICGDDLEMIENQ